MKGLSEFSAKLHVASAALITSGNKNELTNRSTLMLVLSKLPRHLKRRWGSYVVDKPGSGLEALDQWFQREVKAAVLCEGYEPPNAADNDVKPKGSKGKGDDGRSVK